MRYSLSALITLLLMGGCASKAPHKKMLFEFIGIHKDGTCDVDDKLTKWDAKTGALVLHCK